MMGVTGTCNRGLAENIRLNRCVKPKKPKPIRTKQLNCGRLSQRPCKVFERVPSCNKGLVENLAKGRCLKKNAPLRHCGNRKQRPCKVHERIPSCNKGLVEDFAVGKCLRPEEASGKKLEKQFMSFANRFVRENQKLAKTLTSFAESLTRGPTARYFQNGGFKRDVEGRRVAQIARRIDLKPLRRQLKQVRGRLPKTITIGVVTEGGVGIGGSMELGIAFDISSQGGPAVIYRSFGINMGLITGGSASVAVSFIMPRPQQMVGEVKGFSFAAGRSVFQGASVGGSLGFWFAPLPSMPANVGFDYRQLIGVGVAVSIGATVLPVDLRGSSALTQRFNGRKWVADGCGGLGKRPCHLVERVPSCRRGLREDFIKHQCVR